MNEYNRLCGLCPAAGELAKMIGLHAECIPQFRDCYIKGECIVLYLRVGGVLRQDYAETIDVLQAMPTFLLVHEQPDDPTYLFFTFRVPQKSQMTFALAKHLDGVHRDPIELMREARIRKRWETP